MGGKRGRIYPMVSVELKDQIANTDIERPQELFGAACSTPCRRRNAGIRLQENYPDYHRLPIWL
jgi:hypothetical protein